MNKILNITLPVYDGLGLVLIYSFSNTGTPLASDDFSFLHVDSTLDLPAQIAQGAADAATYAAGKGYTIVDTKLQYPPNATTSKPGLLSASDKTALNALVAAVNPQSYQTIVSQSGTAAPAVSGGFTPINTYSGAPTFTWARTGAGVYTITASSAVFNTSGKTGVFISPLTNLNASVRAVVTSSTVITITTAVQAVAVLGLLGLTATNTDALLSNTMVYIQTYP